MTRLNMPFQKFLLACQGSSVSQQTANLRLLTCPLNEGNVADSFWSKESRVLLVPMRSHLVLPAMMDCCTFWPVAPCDSRDRPMRISGLFTRVQTALLTPALEATLHLQVCANSLCCTIMKDPTLFDNGCTNGGR